MIAINQEFGEKEEQPYLDVVIEKMIQFIDDYDLKNSVTAASAGILKYLREGRMEEGELERNVITYMREVGVIEGLKSAYLQALKEYMSEHAIKRTREMGKTFWDFTKKARKSLELSTR